MMAFFFFLRQSFSMCPMKTQNLLVGTMDAHIVDMCTDDDLVCIVNEDTVVIG